MVERRKINILHLSDLHFGIEYNRKIPKAELGKRKTTLIQLVDCLGFISKNHEDWRPDIIAITGDIGFAGKKEDYANAKEWLIKLLTEVGVNKEDLILCPGNHDRFIEDIMNNPKYPKNIKDSDDNWYEFESENNIDRFNEFIDFSHDLITPLMLNNEDNYLSGYRDIKAIRFIVLNTARFACGGENDKGKLFLGWPDVNDLVGNKIFTNPRSYDESIIIISLFHHPDNWFHDTVLHQKGEHPATYNFLAERCHIMISGHLHATIISPPRKISDGATHFSVGASYLRQEYLNNCEIFRLDLLKREAERLVINFDSSKVEWVPDFANIKRFNLRKTPLQIKDKSNSFTEIAKNNLEKLIVELTKFEKKFNERTSNAAGTLEFQIKVIPKNLKENLFEDNKFSFLDNTLKKHQFGPTSLRDLFRLMINNLNVSREGLYSAISYSLDRFPMGGNIFIAKEGIVIFKWYYSEFARKKYKRRFPKYYFSGFILGFLDILSALFSSFGYLDDLKLIFSIDKLKGWQYTSFPDELEVDIFGETSSDEFEPYEFEFNVEKLSSGIYKLELVKDKIMRQILLELGRDEDFSFHPEILRDYQ